MLVEWHLAPEQMFDHWSDEKFLAMWDKRNERIEQQNERIGGERVQHGPARRVSDQELFQNMGVKVRTVQ